jgi:hypothetical protein
MEGGYENGTILIVEKQVTNDAVSERHLLKPPESV